MTENMGGTDSGREKGSQCCERRIASLAITTVGVSAMIVVSVRLALAVGTRWLPRGCGPWFPRG